MYPDCMEMLGGCFKGGPCEEARGPDSGQRRELLVWGLGGNLWAQRFLRVPTGRSLAVSDGGGGCKIGYSWGPGFTGDAAVAKLPLEFDKDGCSLPAAPWGRGPRSSELTETVEKSFLPEE